MVTSESIIQELKREHGINSVAVPCPCCCDRLRVPAKPDCPACNGSGSVQYGIDDLEVFS